MVGAGELAQARHDAGHAAHEAVAGLHIGDGVLHVGPRRAHAQALGVELAGDGEAGGIVGGVDDLGAGREPAEGAAEHFLGAVEGARGGDRLKIGVDDAHGGRGAGRLELGRADGGLGGEAREGDALGRRPHGGGLVARGDDAEDLLAEDRDLARRLDADFHDVPVDPRDADLDGV